MQQDDVTRPFVPSASEECPSAVGASGECASNVCSALRQGGHDSHDILPVTNGPSTECSWISCIAMQAFQATSDPSLFPTSATGHRPMTPSLPHNPAADLSRVSPSPKPGTPGNQSIATAQDGCRPSYRLTRKPSRFETLLRLWETHSLRPDGSETRRTTAMAAEDHELPPLKDTGAFHTYDAWKPSHQDEEPPEVVSRLIAFPKKHYKTAPNVAAGFQSLDVSCRGPIRANLAAEDISKESFRVTLETWQGGILNSAGAQWIEHKARAKDCFFGQFDTRDIHNDNYGRSTIPQESSTEIRFPVQFKETPEVVVWLNRIDIPSVNAKPKRLPGHLRQASQLNRVGSSASLQRSNSGRAPKKLGRQPSVRNKPQPNGEVKSPPKLNGHASSNGAHTNGSANGLDEEAPNFRLSAHATHITPQGFRMNLSTWGDSSLTGAGACWIAFPRAKKHVATGTISTSDVRSFSNPLQHNESSTKFPNGWFKRGKPTVLVALSSFDASGDTDLRLKAEVLETSKEGFRWSLDTWGDSTLFSAKANWIALGFLND